MNIIHVMGMRSLKFGGLERFMLTLAKVLNSQNHKLIIIYEQLPTSDFYLNELKKHRAEIIVLPAAGKAIFRFSIAYLKLLRKYNPEIVHCHFDPAGYVALLISWIFGVKYRIRTLHSMISVNNIEVKSQAEIPFRTKILIKLMYNLSTTIVSVSDSIKIHFGQIFGYNSKIQTIYLGVEDNFYNQKNTREKYSIPDKRIITCVAFHGYIKGIDILLSAIAHLKNHYGYNDILLYQIGGGDQNITHQLKTLTKELSISDMVIWMGQQNNVPEILSGADIYCQPSRSEGIPLAIMEACLAALPVVASHVGGIPEAVEDGVTGFLVPKENYCLLAEKLHLLLSDENKRSAMGIRGRAFARNKFEINEQVNKLLTLYI